MICTKCGNKNKEGDNFCTFCGEELTASAVFCPFCGGKVEGEICEKCYRNVNTGAKVCPKCGFPTSGNAKFCVKCGNSIEPPIYNSHERMGSDNTAFETILPITPKMTENRVAPESAAKFVREEIAQPVMEEETEQRFASEPKPMPQPAYVPPVQPQQPVIPVFVAPQAPYAAPQPAKIEPKADTFKEQQNTAPQQKTYKSSYVSPIDTMYKNKQIKSGNFIYAVLGFFVPLAGYILLGIWLSSRKQDAIYAGIGAAVGSVVGPIVIYIITLVAMPFLAMVQYAIPFI